MPGEIPLRGEGTLIDWLEFEINCFICDEESIDPTVLTLT